MTEMPPRKPAPITDRFINEVLERLRQNQLVRRRLPVWGRIHIDRRLPFLFLYRRPLERLDEGTENLLLGEASYVLASADPSLAGSLRALVEGIIHTRLAEFGAFLLVEVWSSCEEPAEADGLSLRKPGFRLLHTGSKALFPTVEAFERSLRDIRLRRVRSEVESVVEWDARPPGLSSSLSEQMLAIDGIHQLGLEVRPVYRSVDDRNVFPLALRDLRREFSQSTKHALVEFIRERTSLRPSHYQMLGRRSVVKAVWQADRILADITERMNFLLSVTPVNLQAAWADFERNRGAKPPRFGYRPLLIAPLEMKRELFSAPIKRIEDPELSWILREKQRELDWQLTALAARDSRDFLYGSLLAFGNVGPSLLRVARNVLESVPPSSGSDPDARKVTAPEFAARARREIDFFKRQHDQAEAGIKITSDVTGLMVSHGTLLIGSELHVPSARLEAMVQHEVGTHVLTFINGRAQPFRLLCAGLAAYDELQEGLAVLSEYLVGGLSAARLRLLAARVIAVKCMTDGADFIETFNTLCNDHGFARRTAFGITARVFRSGGLTKDATYLRGLVSVLRYLRDGGNIEPLLVGKIGMDDLSVMEELLRRKILRPPPLTPRYFDDPAAKARLQAARSNTNLVDLLIQEPQLRSKQ